MANEIKELNVTSLSNSLDISDLTKINLTGDGVLDKFLQLHRLVLDREFDLGRIQGKEYSDSFVATYTINMELAIKFLLEKEKQFYEIELIESQIANSKKDLELKDYELKYIKPKELLIKEAQVNIALQDLLLKTKQVELMEYELINKLPVEIQILQANRLLTEQKIITEKAQTDNTVVGTGSVIDWNIKTLEAQIKGMDQDAKTKLMKMLVDTWTTRMNNDAAEPEPAGLGDSVIASAVAAAKTTIGI